jgi:two-component sensor histidine kinase
MKTASVGTDCQFLDLVVPGTALPEPKRPPNLRAETAAFCELSRVLADDPQLALARTLEIARHLCHAGSAGLSLVRHEAAGQTVMHWEAVSGALASYEGIDTPRQACPCGLCLDAGVTILVSRPARAFDCMQKARPSIVEELIVPLHDNRGTVLGTCWLVHHDRLHNFSSADARMVEQLAHQLVLALKLLEHARERQHALALLQSHHVAQRNLLAYDLRVERNLRHQAEASNNQTQQALALRDAMIHEVNHRTKNTLQVAASLLYLEAHASSSTHERRALLDSHGRLQLLAKVHELLCSDPDTAQTIDMPQLLDMVCDALAQSFGHAHTGVRLQVCSDSISLPVEEAIALALVANEAVTNAYKHAFPNESGGEINVSLRRTAGNSMTLSIIDTGIGFRWRDGADGMGLQLLRMFASQLHGALDVAGRSDAPGTQITLTIDRTGATNSYVRQRTDGLSA